MSFLHDCFSATERRAKWALLLLSLAACSDPCCSQWQAESAVGTPYSYNSARLYLCPSNELTGLELELVRMRDGLRMYINVFGLDLPPEENNPDYSRVFVSFRNYSYHFSAARFLGGQRLLIPEHVQAEIIDFLQEGQPVALQVGRYKSDIYPDKFLDLFHKMVAEPL